MKKYLLLLSLVLIGGCENSQLISPEKNITQKKLSIEKEADLKVVKTVGLGEPCGGKEAMCKVGLICKIKTQNSDGIGECIEAVIEKELSCSKTQDPVCGLKDNNKNGYLNECEAIRHGAEVLNKGFCKLDETVKNNCKARFTSIGNCNKDLSGFVFDAQKNACTKKFAKGCEAETPFTSLEECQEKCVK